jgi:hypothetical protein
VLQVTIGSEKAAIVQIGNWLTALESEKIDLGCPKYHGASGGLSTACHAQTAGIFRHNFRLHR